MTPESAQKGGVEKYFIEKYTCKLLKTISGNVKSRQNLFCQKKLNKVDFHWQTNLTATL